MDIQLLMQSNKALFDQRLMDYLPVAADGQEAVVEAMRYSLINGGKRLRPLFVMAFSRACGCTGSRQEEAIPFGCAVEMVHTYSLIHDDLPCMDDDDMRRGQPSCHKKFGEATALLAGDGLLTLAFQVLAEAAAQSDVTPAGLINMVRILSKNAGVSGMIGGQVIDLKYESSDVSLEQITTVNLLKTSALIEAACLMGCLAANAEKPLLDAASAFAKKIGLAFQIQDDILDICGDPALLGKQTGSDAVNQKRTYVSILGLEASKKLVAQLTEEAVASTQVFPYYGDELAGIARALIAREN